MTRLNNIKRIAVGTICSVCAVCCIGFAVGNAFGSSEYELDSDSAYVGDDGLVYGVPYEGPDKTIVMPDMARVKATNGNFGYISVDQMYAAIIDYAETEEAGVESVHNTAELKARALSEAFDEYYGVDSISFDDGYRLGEILYRENGRESARALMNDVASSDLAKAIVAGTLDKEKAAGLLVDSVADGSIEKNRVVAVACSLEPSRLNDVFDTSGIQLESTLSDSGGDPARATESSLLELDDFELAELIVELKDETLITGDTVRIQSDAFSSIYKIAQPKVAVYIPVYGEDGATVVGEYRVDRM